MDRQQSQYRQKEEGEEPEPIKKNNWYTFIGAVASGLIPVAMSFGLLRQLRTSVSFENLVMIGVLVILVAFILTVSIRQRYNERIYLRHWKARLERQRAREMRRRGQMRGTEGHRSGQDSRAVRRDDAEADDSDASFEERLLRSLGMEPSP